MKSVFPISELPLIKVTGRDYSYQVRRIFCVGRNYVEHALELGNAVERKQPFYFTKSPFSLLDADKEFNYPPFSRLIKIILKSKNNEKLFTSSQWLANSFNQITNIEVLGPEYPLVSRINNFYIINILLKLDPKSNIPNQKKLIKKLLSKFSNYPEFRSVKVLIDVDPYN